MFLYNNYTFIIINGKSHHKESHHITHKHTHTYIPNQLSQIAICLFFVELIALN